MTNNTKELLAYPAHTNFLKTYGQVRQSSNELTIPIEDAGKIVSEWKALLANMGDGWLPMDQLPDWGNRPIRQLIYIEGHTEHSETFWHRPYAGDAFISKADDAIQGYRREDIERLAKLGDMYIESVKVKAWQPFRLSFPQPPENL